MATLTEQRCLLIARVTRNRHCDAIDYRLAKHTGRWSNPRQHSARNVQQRQQLIIPTIGVNIKEQRAARVRRVGRMNLATGEIPDQPRVHRAKTQLTVFGAGPGTRHVVQQPLKLGAGKISIEHEPRFLLNQLRFARRFQFITQPRRATVLPDDGIRNRSSGGAVPQHCGFALIGDANRRDFLGPCARFGNRGKHDLVLRSPNLGSVVLDPSGLRKMLAQFFLRAGDRCTGMVKQNRPRTGRALIQCQHKFLDVRQIDLLRGRRCTAQIALESASQHSLQRPRRASF